jgi:hypothetical protein
MMNNIKTYEEYNSQNEGLKTWGAGIMTALSLFANTAFADDDKKVKGVGKSMDMEMAIKIAMSDAKSKIINGTGSGKLYGKFGQPRITRDINGNYIATIEYSLDSANIIRPKQTYPTQDTSKNTQEISYQIMNGPTTKKFIQEIKDMGFEGNYDVDSFVDKYSNNYNFKIARMTEEESEQIGDISIKLSKTKNGKTIYCVVTPIGK